VLPPDEWPLLLPVFSRVALKIGFAQAFKQTDLCAERQFAFSEVETVAAFEIPACQTQLVKIEVAVVDLHDPTGAVAHDLSAGLLETGDMTLIDDHLSAQRADGIAHADVETITRNLGVLSTSGLDFAANLEVPAEWLSWAGRDGSISLRSNVNNLLTYKIRNFANAPALDYAGTLSSVAIEAFPDWRAVTSLTVKTGPFNLTGTWRYISAMRDRASVLDPATTIAGPPAYSYFDMAVTLDVNDDFEVIGGLTNIADKTPPVIGGAPSVTNPGIYDIIGRTMFVGLKAKF
jgi:outer membrane receptor protein involved in Fe transport